MSLKDRISNYVKNNFSRDDSIEGYLALKQIQKIKSGCSDDDLIGQLNLREVARKYNPKDLTSEDRKRLDWQVNSVPINRFDPSKTIKETALNKGAISKGKSNGG